MEKNMNIFEEIKSNKTKIMKKHREVNLSEDEMKDVLQVEIYDDDNELCKIIKQLLIDNPVNIKLYASRFNNDQEMSNMKRSLITNRTMSWERFSKWLYVLGYDCEFSVTPKKDNNY